MNVVSSGHDIFASASSLWSFVLDRSKFSEGSTHACISFYPSSLHHVLTVFSPRTLMNISNISFSGAAAVYNIPRKPLYALEQTPISRLPVSEGAAACYTARWFPGPGASDPTPPGPAAAPLGDDRAASLSRAVTSRPHLSNHQHHRHHRHQSRPARSAWSTFIFPPRRRAWLRAPLHGGCLGSWVTAQSVAACH